MNISSFVIYLPQRWQTKSCMLKSIETSNKQAWLCNHLHSFLALCLLLEKLLLSSHVTTIALGKNVLPQGCKEETHREMTVQANSAERSFPLLKFAEAIKHTAVGQHQPAMQSHLSLAFGTQDVRARAGDGLRGVSHCAPETIISFRTHYADSNAATASSVYQWRTPPSIARLQAHEICTVFAIETGR